MRARWNKMLLRIRKIEFSQRSQGLGVGRQSTTDAPIPMRMR